MSGRRQARTCSGIPKVSGNGHLYGGVLHDMASGGFVYVITNRAMPGLVKVGRTTRMPEERARELGGAGVPYPYEVRYALRTSAHRAVEAAAHRLLRPARLQHEGGGVEWFACTVGQAKSAIKRAARKVDGLFQPGSFMQLLVSSFRQWLVRIDVFLFILAAIIVLGPATWPLLAGHAARWLPEILLPPLSGVWPTMPADWRACQPYALAWVVARVAGAWGWHCYQLSQDYRSPQPARPARKQQKRSAQT